MKIAFVLPGLALFGAGFVALFALLASQGALARRGQIAAFATLGSGRAGAGKRVALVLALVAIGVGTCASFAGIVASDADRKSACEAKCKQRGYARASIRGSTARDPAHPDRHAFVACACEGGPAPDPLELEADGLAP